MRIFIFAWLWHASKLKRESRDEEAKQGEILTEYLGEAALSNEKQRDPVRRRVTQDGDAEVAEGKRQDDGVEDDGAQGHRLTWEAGDVDLKSCHESQKETR